MKIREKLFLILCVTVLIFTIIFAGLNLFVFNSQYQKEQVNSAYRIIKQIMLSYTYNTGKISRYIYEASRSGSVSSYLEGIRQTSDISLDKVLKNITVNHKAIRNGIFIANNGDTFFYMNNDEETQSMISLWKEGSFDTDDDIHWFYMDDGKIYLKRNIHKMSPYEVVGSGVFEIDSAYMCSIIGVNNLKIGSFCIIDKYGDFRLLSNNEDHLYFGELIDILRSGRSIGQKMVFDDEVYRVITVNDEVSTEKAIYIVKESDLLQPYYEIRNFSYRIMCMVLIVAWIVSYFFANLFTNNLRLLKRQINDIKASDDISKRITSSNKHDEIGELANDFNHLLDKINLLYEKNLKKSKAQQNAKYEMLNWQYRALQSQVSPHFLCNILSSISALASIGSYEDIQLLSVTASRYLRLNLNSSKKNSTLREEINLSQEYVNLVSVMSAVPILLETNCISELDRIQIPSYLLQPLVENSIKHGIIPGLTDALRICIDAEIIQTGKMRLTVSDNGCGFNEEIVEKIQDISDDKEVYTEIFNFGLTGIIQRMKLQYEDSFRFRTYNKPEGGAAFEMEFPISFAD